MKTVVATAHLTDEQADKLVGSQLTNASYDVLFRESVRVVREDGSPLAVFVRRAVPDDIAAIGYRVLRKINADPRNRMVTTYGGRILPSLKPDGTRAKTPTLTKDVLKKAGMEGASSQIIGYMDRYTRLPFCRKTAFNMNNPGEFEAAMPFIQACSNVFAREVPERYEAQLAVARRTHPDWIIPGTAFTTITVNKNYPTRVHKDSGDLKQGFGCMAVLRAGHYTGGYFVFPKYRVAFDCGSGDVLLADVHEWHGNTRFGGSKGKFERVSCVFYYREKMQSCGSAVEELARAKHRQPGDPLWDSIEQS